MVDNKFLYSLFSWYNMITVNRIFSSGPIPLKVSGRVGKAPGRNTYSIYTLEENGNCLEKKLEKCAAEKNIQTRMKQHMVKNVKLV